MTCCALTATALAIPASTPRASEPAASSAGRAAPRAAMAVQPKAPPRHEEAVQPKAPPRREEPARSARVGQSLAEQVLRENGIGWRSSGNCADPDRTDCTSFAGIRWGSISGLIAFKKRSGCPITISGGTERGHASGPFSHSRGYKMDIRTSDCIDRAIEQRFRSAGGRGDGAELYRSPGVLYAREDSHWDITFY